VAGRQGQLGDTGVAREPPQDGGRVGWGIGRPGLLEQVLGEPEDPAAQDVEGVVGQLDREAPVAEGRQDGCSSAFTDASAALRSNETALVIFEPRLTLALAPYGLTGLSDIGDDPDVGPARQRTRER